MDNVDFVLKRLDWLQQDLFDTQDLIADVINLVRLGDDAVNKLSDKSKYNRELIIKAFANSNDDLIDLAKLLESNVEEIMDEVMGNEDN